LTAQSEREVITVRLSQNAVQRAFGETFRNSNIGSIYHGSEITSVKVGNNSKRSHGGGENYIGGERNLTRQDQMSIDLVVHIADDGHVATEEKLRSILEAPIRDTKLPLGADVRVSRVTIGDFDECASGDHNDCSAQSDCLNMDGSYTCQCREGYHDLSGSESLSGRVCSGN
jgi:hypothetical protein